MSESERFKPMLAKKYNGQNPKGWMMSEKLDGVRAIWDGETIKSRNGKVFNAPAWFTKGLPKGIMLDGELWGGRGLFSKTVGKVRARQGDWSTIRFMIFDTPADGEFTERYNNISALGLPYHCGIVEHTECKSEAHLNEFLNSILEKNGEGVMLRAPTSNYDNKRSNSLLKVKRFNCDEATITGYTKGTGKHTGRLGALICEYKGKTFQIGTGLSNTLRDTPPSIGSTVTFSFFEITSGGVPRFPSFIGVRDYE